MSNIPAVPFKSGSSIFVAGPTHSGKTHWVYRLLATPHMFDQPIASVLYCYGVYQPLYNDIRDHSQAPVTFLEGIPTQKDLVKMYDKKFHIIVIDDLMEKVVKNLEMQEMILKYCHHNCITAILISQNIFQQGRYSRTISLNMHNVVLFSNKRDALQVRTIARQFFPTNHEAFVEVFKEVTDKKHGYLLIDCTPIHPRVLQLRTNIFPPETCIVYNIC